MTEQIKAIDIISTVYFAETAALQPGWLANFLSKKIGQDQSIVQGLTIAQTLEKMDRAGVERALLAANKSGSVGHPVSRRVPVEVAAAIIAQHPDRFSGLVGIDPTEGMKGVRELEYAVKELGFVGAHFYPHWFDLPPDHRKVYPFYAKCVELDVPIMMQVGHCLRSSEDRPLRSVGRPITRDTGACDFPELKLIGIHVGWPWTEEMISVAWKHPNVYIGSDAYAPKYWSEPFVHFIDSWGRDKVLFGTDWPVIDPERAIAEIEELGLRPEAKRKFLRENALRVFKLPG
ncbi:MAG: amidohydrolase [Chloroflexi bacterium]|nr:amidohydrolase [Chloroflexota bacterium]